MLSVNFDDNPATSQCEKARKGLRVSNFALLLVVFSQHHDSEGVDVLSSMSAHAITSDRTSRHSLMAVAYAFIQNSSQT